MTENKRRFFRRLRQRVRDKVAQVVEAPAHHHDVVAADCQLHSDDKGALPSAIISQILVERVNVHLASFSPQGILENDQRNRPED